MQASVSATGDASDVILFELRFKLLAGAVIPSSAGSFPAAIESAFHVPVAIVHTVTMVLTPCLGAAAWMISEPPVLSVALQM